MKTSIFALIAVACALLSTAAFAEDPPQFKVLMISTTNGWHHEAIAEAVPAVRELAAKHQFEVVWEENVARMFTEENLKRYDVIMFMLTTGDILNPEQQALMERFIRSGKGFVGVHCASDTEAQWPWYTQLLGRSFHIHPRIQTAEISVIDRTFPGTERLPQKFWFTDEYYEFGEENVHGLNYVLSVDERTYDPVVNWEWDKKSGKGMGKFHPISWNHEFDGGRSFFTALGHMPADYQDDLFMEHLWGGIYWAATGKGWKK